MPTSVQEHYDNLLAEHYDWMFGTPFESQVAQQQAILEKLVGAATADDKALDLGCGSGFQSMALHELGYEVLAIDTNGKLLGDLAARTSSRRLTTRREDMRDLSVAPGTFDVAVCMGDTLTHLSTKQEVSRLFRSAACALKPRGRFILTYRDLASGELRGLDRFIPVRSDDTRVMTCFLEYEGPETVIVHDLIYDRKGDNDWQLQKSSYRKLRLGMPWVCDELVKVGLAVTSQHNDRLSTVAAVKL